MKKKIIISSILIILCIISINILLKKSIKKDLTDQNLSLKKFIDNEMDTRKGKLELTDSDDGISAVKDIKLNKDKRGEKIVTYSVGTETKSLNFLILREQNDVYSVIKDINFRGDEIEKIYLKDLTNDGKDNIIINSSEGNSKILTIYSFEDNFKKLLEIDYSSYLIEDINSDGNIDIIIFKNVGNILSVDYYRFNKVTKKIEFINEKIGYTDITSLSEPIVNNVEKNKKGIIINGKVANSILYTFLYGIDESGKLENMLNSYSEDNNALKQNFIENFDFLPRDINGDGIIDIPKASYMIEKNENFILSKDNYINSVEWQNFKNGKFMVKENYIYLDEDNLFFEMPKNWSTGEITGVKKRGKIGIEYIFSKRDNKTGKKYDIMTIIRTNNKPEDKFKFITKEKGYKYYIKVEKITDSEYIKPYLLDENYMNKNFLLSKKLEE